MTTLARSRSAEGLRITRRLDAAREAENAIAAAIRQISPRLNSVPQARALLLAYDSGGMINVADVARALQISRQFAVMVIDLLEERALIERWRPDNDHKRVNVRLTAAGRLLAPAVLRIFEAADKAVRNG